MAKQDYSRLLDDEFLNAGERVRVRVVARGAALALGAPASWARRPSYSTLLTCGLAATLMGATLMLVVSLCAPSALMLRRTAHVAAVTPRSDADPMRELNTVPSDSSADARELLRTLLDNHDHDLHHGHDLQLQHPAAGPGGAARARPDAFDDHHMYLSGGFLGAHDNNGDLDDQHPHDIHEHVNPGDVVLEDHHIVPADGHQRDNGDHVLLLCLAADKHPQGVINATTNSTTPVLNITRAQRDAVHSAAEFLGNATLCHLVVLEGLDSPPTEGSTTLPPPSSSSELLQKQLLSSSGHTGCGSFSGDDDTLGATPGGVLELASGRRLPIVLWDAELLFNKSRLAAVPGAHWRQLASQRTSSGASLIDLAARLLLLWRFGGVSVDLHASADQVLKTMSAVNKSDSSHVYLETTRATVVTAPQTCNAVIFDLINSVAKHLMTDAGPITTTPTQEHEHYDSGDVQVFDEVLNAYCRGQWSSGNNAQPSSSPEPPSTTTPRTTVTKSRGRSRSPLGLLMEGPNVPTTTPDPSVMRVDTTLCKGNLVAISLQ